VRRRRDALPLNLVKDKLGQKMPEELMAEADFTLNGVSDVERFLKWMSQTASQLS